MHVLCLPYFTRETPLYYTAKSEKTYVEAPALPTDTPPPPKGEKAHMEDFLDDLLG